MVLMLPQLLLVKPHYYHYRASCPFFSGVKKRRQRRKESGTRSNLHHDRALLVTASSKTINNTHVATVRLRENNMIGWTRRNCQGILTPSLSWYMTCTLFVPRDGFAAFSTKKSADDPLAVPKDNLEGRLPLRQQNSATWHPAQGFCSWTGSSDESSDDEEARRHAGCLADEWQMDP